MINNQNNFVLYAVITADLINSVIFQEALDIAREKNYPCFFVIDDKLDLPKGWYKNLKIEFLDYFKDHNSRIKLAIKMYNQVKTFNQSTT